MNHRRQRIVRRADGFARRARNGRRRRLLQMHQYRLTCHDHTHQDGVTALDFAMMRRAIELAKQAASRGEVPVGAVVYCGERIIAEAANNRELTHDPVGHAELLAMSAAGRRQGDWRLSDCSLAVTLEPCPMCAGAMVNSRLGRVIYGAPDLKAGACHSLYSIPTDDRLNHKVKVYGDVLRDECAQILTDFFRMRREQNKRKRRRKSA